MVQTAEVAGDRLADLQGRLADGIIDVTDHQEEEKRDELDGSFEKITIPMPNENVEFKAGDLIYSGEMHMSETENLMGDILNDYSHLISKNQQDFNEKFGQYLPKKDEDHN